MNLIEVDNYGIRTIFDKDLSLDSDEVLCDGCHKWSSLNDWTYAEIECEDCGYHPATSCPLCGWTQDWLVSEKDRLYTRHI